jgi:hypothetical protein
VKNKYHEGVYKMNRAGEKIGRTLHVIVKNRLSSIFITSMVIICGTIGFVWVLGKTSLMGKKK